MQIRKLSRTVRLGVVAVLATTLIVGCTSSPAPTAATASSSAAGVTPGVTSNGVPKLPKGTTIGLAMRELVNGFDTDIVDGVKASAAAAGATVTVTDAGGDQTKQITQIRQLISSGVKGIVIGLGSPEALASVVSEAKAKGIVVTSAAIGTPIPGALADVAGNEFLVGTLAAASMLQYIKFSGDVYALSVPGAPVLDARLNAITGMAKTYPNVTIHVIPTEHSAAKVFSQVQSLLAAHPHDADIKAIWVAYDQLATGAVQAVQQAKRNIPVFSADGGVEGFKMLTDPTSPFMSTVADKSSVMGTMAGKYLVLGIAGQTKDIPAESFGPSFTVSRNNIVKAAEEQFGPKAWDRIGTTAKTMEGLYNQNMPVWPVTPLIINSTK